MPPSTDPLWHRRAQREWTRWLDGLDFGPDTPALAAPGGLPEEWEVEAVREADQHTPGIAIICRTAGGWLLVRNDPGLKVRDFLRAEPTLTALYQAVVATEARNSAGTRTAASIVLHGSPTAPPDSRVTRLATWWTQTAQMTQDLLVAKYDQTDPTERAEAMLVAMGGRATHPPATDVAWGEALLLVAP